jgi:two-component system nitrogen regulation sensor histidine kinase NtrY
MTETDTSMADAASVHPSVVQRGAQRAFARLIPARAAEVLAIILTVAAVIAGIATFLAMWGWGEGGPNATATQVLLIIDLFIVLGLAALVGMRLVKLWRAHRTRTAGSLLHIRLVLLFAVIAMTPTVLIAMFAAIFFTFGVQSWFGDRVKTAVTESAAVAQAYLREHQQAIRGEALQVAGDINRNWHLLSVNSVNHERLNDFLSKQVGFRGLDEAIIFTADGQIIAKGGYAFALEALSGEKVTGESLNTADRGDVSIVISPDARRVRALVKLGPFPTMYLQVGRFVDVQVLNRLNRTEEAVSEYLRLEGERFDLQMTFALLFGMVALLLLMVSVWFGLQLATRLARPVIELINAAESVRGGDLSVRVSENTAGDEVAYLSRAFNRMTKRLAEQQTALKDTNAQLDARRRFTETVLEGVSAGVIGLDRAGNITLPNRSASVLLGTDLLTAIGRPLSEAVPEFGRLLDELRETPKSVVQREVDISLGRSTKTFLVRVSAEQGDDADVGYIATFDDITALQAAQRKAAWADVARRIAHEIKNPLTPIQLSAERLKRKYAGKILDDTDLFTQCTDTIIRHVGDIGQMVDEFSSFARLPAAVLQPADLTKVVRDAVMLHRTAYPRISFTNRLPGAFWIKCDARQVGQALTNVIKNAVEAVEARVTAGALTAGQGQVIISLAEDGQEVVVTVTDNGIGLPEAERARLTEPYVTTRAKGTGLGLAMVRKIVEEHGGRITLKDTADGIGAQVTLHFPATLKTEPGKAESAPPRTPFAVAGE